MNSKTNGRHKQSLRTTDNFDVTSCTAPSGSLSRFSGLNRKAVQCTTSLNSAAIKHHSLMLLSSFDTTLNRQFLKRHVVPYCKLLLREALDRTL